MGRGFWKIILLPHLDIESRSRCGRIDMVRVGDCMVKQALGLGCSIEAPYAARLL